MSRPRLSICIASLGARGTMLGGLIAELASQERFTEVEILVDIDGGRRMRADKRNRLLQLAAGDYVCSIDDDDLVSHEYLPAILGALDGAPGVDCVLIRGRCTDGHEFDYRLGGRDGEWTQWPRCVWHTPNHLTPVRTELAKRVPFARMVRGEDLLWGKAMAPLLKTSVRAGGEREILYIYQLVHRKPLHTPSWAPPAALDPGHTYQATSLTDTRCKHCGHELMAHSVLD